jgi:hypothetical protein
MAVLAAGVLAASAVPVMIASTVIVSTSAVTAVTAAAVTTVTAVTAATTPECSHIHSPEKPGHSDVGIHCREIRVIGEGRIFGPPPVPIDNRRVVTRYIDNLRIDRLDIEILTFDNHPFYVAGSEIARGECFLAQSLNRCRYIGFLSLESLTQSLRPRRLLSHHREYLREWRQRLHARVPVHCVHGVTESVLRKIRVSPQPMINFHDLVREGRCHHDLRKQRIRIQRDWGKHLVKLRLAECLA